MNVFEILSTKYEEEWLKGKMAFKDDNNGLGIVIDRWDLDIPQPTPEEIASYEADMLPIFELNQLRNKILVDVGNLFDMEARKKKYANALSVASYVNSTVSQWASEAQTFIAWRDAVWVYCITEFDKAKNGDRDIVSSEEFLTELPLINW